MIHQGKFFARREQDFVVFMLGMRIHNVWKVRKWAQVYRLIPGMLKELDNSEGLGYLGGISKITFRQPLIIQYWESLESLHQYATNPQNSHLEVWKTFNKVVGKSKDIGIWHETYLIPAHGHENIYINMPFTGIGQFTPLNPVGKDFYQYRKRFGQKEQEAKMSF